MPIRIIIRIIRIGTQLIANLVPAQEHRAVGLGANNRPTYLWNEQEYGNMYDSTLSWKYASNEYVYFHKYSWQFFQK